jgi:PAS domain S-box-containing protein
MSEIPELRRLTEALQASEARLRAVIECLPLDFWMIGHDGRYVMQNSICRTLWGEIIGKRPQDLPVDAETMALWQENNRRAFSGEVVRGEVMFASKGGRRHFYNVVGPILDGGRTIGILGINLDITERKEAEAELRRRNEDMASANEKLESLSRVKDRMTAMISHELRTPLVTGLGYLEMLLEHKLGPISERVRSKMAIARRNLQRLARLVDLVLRYQSILEMGHQELPSAAPFDIASLVHEVRNELSGRGEPTPAVEVALEADLPPVLGDRELIRMVLANLLNNTMAHAGPEATVRIACCRDPENGVRVAVEDSGVGIPSAIQKSVFEPFVRGDPAREGYGLGLSVVRAILAAHRSEATLHSEEGQGTIVSFWLRTAASPA